MSEELIIREARQADLAPIVAMLADDVLGQAREVTADPVDDRYRNAFDAIRQDNNQQLVVAEIANTVSGCLQLTFIPGLSRTGMWRAQIESVRIARNVRGQQVGREMLEWAINQSKVRGCGLVQLTTDKTRAQALRFYESLGFVASHEGMKLSLQL